MSAKLALALGLLAAPLAWGQDPCTAPAVTTAASQARTLVQQKKYSEAQAPARQALAACPTQADATSSLGESLVGLKQHDAAITAMNDAIARKSDQSYAYLWRGYAYYSKKQVDRMVGDFETFLRLAPNAPEAAAVRQLLSGMRR